MNIAKKDWFCYVCSLQFDSKHIYGLHLKLLHKKMSELTSIKNGPKSIKLNNQNVSIQIDSKTFQCEICLHNFRKDNLKRHISTVHKGNKQFKCHFCNSTFTQKGNLKTHVTSVHERKKSFKCDFCNDTYSQKNQLKKHIDSVHGANILFKCEFCNHTASRKDNLKTFCYSS